MASKEQTLSTTEQVVERIETYVGVFGACGRAMEAASQEARDIVECFKNDETSALRKAL